MKALGTDLYIGGNTMLNGSLQFAGGVFSVQDASFNGGISVKDDSSFNSNLFIDKHMSIGTNNVSGSSVSIYNVDEKLSFTVPYFTNELSYFNDYNSNSVHEFTISSDDSQNDTTYYITASTSTTGAG